MTYVSAFIMGMFSILAGIVSTYLAFRVEKWSGPLAGLAVFFYMFGGIMLYMVFVLPG